MSLITLLEFAIQNHNVQLILLSPQDVAMVEEAKQQIVQKGKALPDPEFFMKVVQMRHARQGADHN